LKQESNIDIFAWEDGCKGDDVRNNLVLPHLNQLIDGSKFRSVIDIGCATGYITRLLANKHQLKGIEWVLLDSSEEMLHFAIAALGSQLSAKFIKVDITNSEEVQLVHPADMAFIVFTTLEFRMTKRIAQNVADLLIPGGILAIFLPDVLYDVIKSNPNKEDHLWQYADGHCELPKLDKFTKQPYPFHANRIETIIADFLDAGLQLLRLTIYQRNEVGKGGAIFGLDFKKGV